MKQPKITDITFVQHSLPPLEAGKYTLVLKQTISAASNKEYSEEATIFVNGPRFFFKPELVVQVFPPAETTGDYTSILPHLVLKSKTLPWERSVDADENNNIGITDEPAWLALLVFDQTDQDFRYPEGEKLGAHFRAQSGTVQDLYDTDEQTLSYFTAAKADKPNISELLENDQQASDPCRFIDIPVGLFKEIAPTMADLPWLSHNQKGTDNADNFVAEVSVLMANRLAKEGSMTTVHLVSLEGMGQYLPDDQGQAQDIPAGIAFVRLVSFHSWTFNPEPVQLKFSTYLKNLNYDAQRPEGAPIEGLLRMPQRDSNYPAINEKNKNGFLPLLHHLRTGGQQFSWYRGPLSPQVVQLNFSFDSGRPFSLPVRSADALLIFQESTGLFTASYAAAWQLGRLIALSNKAYATTLYNWKAKQLRVAMLQVRKAVDTSSVKQRKDFYKDLIDRLGNVDYVKKNNTISPILPPIVLELLSELLLLRGVPFTYLVPSAEMLPKESLKFFYLDINWLACLLDGALSIGRSSKVQWAYDQAFLSDYLDQVVEASDVGATSFKKVAISGLLWRSAGVKGWDPDINIDVYASDQDQPAEKDELPKTRLENLAPEVKIGLYQGHLTRVNISEPPIGTHFGILPELNAEGQQQKELCYLASNKVGQPMLKDDPTAANGKKAVTVPVPVPAEARDALNVAGLASNIKDGLPEKPQVFTSAEFALQMIEGMEQIGFCLKND